MVNISKFGDSSIKFTFTQNDHYLYGQGEITVPLNSLNLIIDESDMVTFKKIDGDTFISFLIGNSNFSSKNDLEDWYKENMVGGGSSVSSGDVQTMIDESISGKVDTSAVTTSVTSASTDSEIPTAKAVWEAASGGGTTYSAGRGIDITNDTISVSLPISAGTGNYSIIEGRNTQAMSFYDHAEGYNTYANGGTYAAHAEGYGTSAMTYSAHAEGRNTKANGNASHAEGRSTKANGEGSHTEGKSTIADGANSHAEGSYTSASSVSNVSGIDTYDGHQARHAEGSYTLANNSSTHAEGYYTIANNFGEHASGVYNNSTSASTTFGDSGNTLFSVGNGTANNARHNAFEIRQNADIYIVSGGTDIKLQDHLGGGGITSGEVQSMIDASTSGYTARFAEDEEVTAAGLNALNEALSGKQDTLSAGTNITIVDNVISAEGGGKAVSGGTNISITTGETANTINCTLPISTDGNYLGKGIILGNGNSMRSRGASSIVGGDSVSASTNAHYSVGFGRNINLSNEAEFGSGKYSVTNSASSTFGDSGNTLFSVGNGTANNARHNAFEIRQNGDIYITSGGTDIKLQDNLGGGGGITSGEVQSMIDASTSGYTARFAEDEEVTAAGLNALNEALSGKQDTLSVGRGISIDSADTISLDLAISGGSGTNSIAENIGTTASGNYSHAEGFYTNADGSSSHAEGGYTSASTDYAHAEGYSTYASMQAHAEGQYTSAMTNSSHAEGAFTYTSNNAEHASGQYNVSSSGSSTFGDSGNTLFSVGNGTADNARHNAFEIRQNGDIYCNNGTSDVKLQDYLQIKVVKLTQSAYDALSPNYDNNTLYAIID